MTTSRCRGAVLVLLSLVALLGARSANAQSQYDRKASARATISGSRGIYDGTFAATGIAKICGEFPKEMSFSGTDSFIIEYPLDAKDTDQIQNISFGTDELVRGRTKGTKFALNISVRLPNGSKPYPYVLITNAGRPGNTGTQTLTKGKNGSVTVTIAGKSERGETILLAITCN